MSLGRQDDEVVDSCCISPLWQPQEGITSTAAGPVGGAGTGCCVGDCATKAGASAAN